MSRRLPSIRCATYPHEHMFADASLVSRRETAAILALMAARALPWNRIAGAVEEEGGALALLEALQPSTPETLFPIEEKRVTLDQLENYVSELAAEDIRVVTVLDEDYPVNLRMVHDRPPLLFFRGTLLPEDERSVAVVGTRRASAAGTEAARRVVADLAAAGYVIVSGLAAGVDTAAHTAALELGARTVGVIGTGLRHSFPKENAALQDRLAREAAVVSQFWPGQEPRRWTFPQRNAVMSGLARATVVVEAGNTSGARVQARLAHEHGRPVFLHHSLLEHDWARDAKERPGTYVIDDGEEVVAHLHRLYESQLALSL